MSANPTIRIRAGSFYFGEEVYDRFFRGVHAVAFLRRDDLIVVAPIHAQGGGGSLIKVRNLRGDRVIHAREFLLELGVDESEEHELPAEWDAELAALTMPNPSSAPAAMPTRPHTVEHHGS